MEHAIEHEGWKIVLLLRLTPLVPFNLLNYALACTAVRFWDYTWASSVGVLPGMVCRNRPAPDISLRRCHMLCRARNRLLSCRTACTGEYFLVYVLCVWAT